MTSLFLKIMREPRPVRRALGLLLKNIPAFQYKTRVELFWENRPHYAYCVLKGAELAQKLKIKDISVVEFGVAGGNGLLNLEIHAAAAERATGVKVHVFGFDTGIGLPPPVDYKDLPYHWQEGFFAVDRQRLASRLQRAKIFYGLIDETKKEFIASSPPPIAAAFHDFDYFSSTRSAFEIFMNTDVVLPRSFHYFDDIVGGDIELYNDQTGQRGAISEFNAANSDRRFHPLTYLHPNTCPFHWQVYSLHLYAHPSYPQFISDDNQQLLLRGR